MRLFLLSAVVGCFSFSVANAGQPHFDKWYTTYTVDKFPCMNKQETEFLKKIIDTPKVEQRFGLLAKHRRQVLPSARQPASVRPDKIKNMRFICPPYKGVNNPYPEVVDFGKAADFERIRITDSYMEILNGRKKNQKWELKYNPQVGYYEGQNPSGTPINLIPMGNAPGKDPRFLVQYLYFKDKSALRLTLCYPENMHKQCNPYTNPASKKSEGIKNAPERVPASVNKVERASKS